MERLLIFAVLAVVSLASLRADEAPRKSRGGFPKVGNYEVLRGDFHMHTVNSDGKSTTRERMEESRRLGYDVVAVTDHRTMRAYRLAKALGEPLGLIVIRGIETGVKGAEHINVIGIDDTYKPQNPHSWSETPNGDTAFYRDDLEAIARHGGYVFYNHPHVGYREPVEWGVAHGLIQGIEVKNEVVGDGWNTVDFRGSMCYPSAFDFGLEHNLTLFANTDAHGNSRSENPPVTLVFATEKSEKGVMDALWAGRTVAWFDGMLWGKPEMVTMLVNAMISTAWSPDTGGGGQVTLTNRGPVTLSAELERPEKVTLQLPKYGSASFACGKLLDNLDVRWTNVWINTRETLVTRIAPSQ